MIRRSVSCLRFSMGSSPHEECTTYWWTLWSPPTMQKVLAMFVVWVDQSSYLSLYLSIIYHIAFLGAVSAYEQMQLDEIDPDHNTFFLAAIAYASVVRTILTWSNLAGLKMRLKYCDVTVIYCDILWYTLIYCGILWYTVMCCSIYCDVLWYTVCTVYNSFLFLRALQKVWTKLWSWVRSAALEPQIWGRGLKRECSTPLWIRLVGCHLVPRAHTQLFIACSIPFHTGDGRLGGCLARMRLGLGQQPTMVL